MDDYDQLLAAAAETGDIKHLEKVWYQIPEDLRIDTPLSVALQKRHKPRCWAVVDQRVRSKAEDNIRT